MTHNRLDKFRTAYRKFRVSKSPQFNLVWGFLLYMLLGFLLLSLPIFHKTDVSFIDNLFTSTSAISTTGLVSVSVYDSYNFFGQFIIMGLIQVGGIGYMTLTSYYLLLTTKSITRWHNRVIGAEFSMPKNIQIRDFIKSVIVFTVIMETLGAIAFYYRFSAAGMDAPEAVWFSVFHSVSSFCTAGFGLFNDSFESFSNDPAINTIVSVLSIAGSLGFIVITDLWYRISGKSNSISFTTKIITYGFIILLTFGTLVVYFSEPLTQASGATFTESFFLAMTSMTTVGFNTIPTGDLSHPILLLVIFLMYIGASPSGTAGGMKITTLTAVLAILKSRLLGQKKISFLNRAIPYERLFVATSIFLLYTITIFFFTFLMSFSEPFDFEDILFEVSSALGTVGLSTGITGDITSYSKFLLIILMFLGRVGVLTFGFAIMHKSRHSEKPAMEDDLAV